MAMTLKQKAKIYQKGGKYLAQKEENTFVQKNIIKWMNNWNQLEEHVFYNHNFLNYIFNQIGDWQVRHGFYIRMKNKKEILKCFDKK